VSDEGGFVPPPYPYDRLVPLRELADGLPGGCVDLSVGTPCDPPPPEVLDALARSSAERSYPPSVGTPEVREAFLGWLERRFSVHLDPAQVAACIGTKELVAGLPSWLRLRTPARDTVLYPAVSYPTYAMGATLAGCRAVPVPLDERWRLRLDQIDEADVERALCLWVNTPGNPAGGLDDLAVVAAWGREHEVPVFSDECYVEFTWDGPPSSGQPISRLLRPGEDAALPPELSVVRGRSILEHGTEGVVAVHSLSKRSNLAGLRAGFYAGDRDLVHYLSEVRKHAGFMVPGPVQAAATAALADDEHVQAQRVRYWQRLDRMRTVLAELGIEAPLPGGSFYLWVPAPRSDAWGLAEMLARQLGVLVSPGEFYGPQASGHVRIAMVQPDERLSLVEDRAGALSTHD
jgi:succinyldiaminopimelate transaminase